MGTGDGLSSGFGIDFAHLLAARGANLVLVARRGEPMRALAAELKRTHGTHCHVITMDLARPGVGAELHARIRAKRIAINVLINNAGFGVFGDFVDQPLASEMNMLQLNVMALTELTHVFATDMVTRGAGKILLVGSLGGFQPLPMYATYAASKAYRDRAEGAGRRSCFDRTRPDQSGDRLRQSHFAARPVPAAGLPLAQALMSKELSLLLVGAIGAVGEAVLRQALAEKRITRIVAPTRRPLEAEFAANAKLLNPVINFARLPEDAPWWRVDAVVCTLGTTIKVAGSQAAFTAIDRDLPIALARLARQAGATRHALTSSLGASASGSFYLRTKAEAEQGIIDLGFASTTIVRPSLIDTERSEARPGEQVELFLAHVLRPLIPRRYRAVSPEAIAAALLRGILDDHAGVKIVESEAL